MLKQRIFTALLLIPLFVVLVLSLTPHHFAFLTAAIVLGCAWEWAGLIGLKTILARMVYSFFIIFILVALVYTFSQQFLTVTQVFYITFVWWLIAALLVVFYPKGSSLWGQGILIRGIMGIFTLIPCWIALNFIRITPHGEYILLFLFVLIWGADSGAYFIGKKWGKNKLIPEVSPGKSWQGFFGALLTSIFIVIIAIFLFKISNTEWISLLLLALVTVLFSVLGDLFESMLKRKVGLKDSGRILPGHGGILDRIDSLTAAAPIFALGLIVIQK